ncbi:MAG: DUF3551 domain-containing protein [Hyphomicrobiales bacterium]|nr:DUF3551 domain-containing protein [Hyphomicrobiales bacterium]
MRKIIFLAAALAALPLSSGAALADGSWCARDVKGGTNCGFHTYAQCMANISGIGGVCSPNPFMPPASSSRRPSRSQSTPY